MLTIDNLISPQILFFALGFIARIVKSDLSLPDNFGKLISVYMLIAIGLHGGEEIRNGNFSDSIISCFLALFLSIFLPILGFAILRKILHIDSANSAAISAHYGSVSISTFMIAAGYLKSLNISFEGYPVLMLAIMESPAIIIALILAEFNKRNKYQLSQKTLKYVIPHILSKAFRNGYVFLLIGSIGIGYILSENNLNILNPLFRDNFTGILCLFLLAMGIEAAENFQDFKKIGFKLMIFAIFFPIISFYIGAILSKFIGFDFGTSFLVGVLSASASYIAVPPAIRVAIPSANPAYYLTMSIGVTFTFNVVLGMHLYLYINKFIF